MIDTKIETRIKQEYDVIVVGGGIAGVSAAVAASRAGSRVLLMEKGINLGGLATAGLISWYEPLCDGNGTQMIGGIGEELIRLAVRVGFDNLPKSWGGEREPATPRNDRFSSFFSPTFFAMALDAYVMDAGVELLFDTRATYPIMDGNRCRGILAENINGREFYPAKMVIDASGDAVIASRVGIPCESGENFFTYIVHCYDRNSAEKYAASGDTVKFRRWKNCGSTLTGKGHPDGMKLFHGDSAEEVTEFVLTGKQKMMEAYAGTDRTERDIMMLPSMPQFRTIRHIVGKTLFDGSTDGIPCADSIGSAGDFRTKGRRFDIPYSTLYHPEYPNLLTAGRIISSTGDGWEITRVIPVCALTGQAAGTAAALAIQHGASADAVPYPELYSNLKQNGVLFALEPR